MRTLLHAVLRPVMGRKQIKRYTRVEWPALSGKKRNLGAQSAPIGRGQRSRGLYKEALQKCCVILLCVWGEDGVCATICPGTIIVVLAFVIAREPAE